MLRCRMGMLFVVVAFALGMLLPAVAQATVVTVNADAYVSPRPSGNLYACNAGGQAICPIGGEGTWAGGDYTNGLLRWDLSAVGQTALGDVTLTIHHGDTPERENPRNFEGYSLDLFVMPSNNADWVEGTGAMDAVAGVAWNRKKGEYSLSPPDADKWLPTATNSHQAGASLVQSIDWYSAMGKTVAFTVPQATFNAAVSGDGKISFLLRSLDVEAQLQSGDGTQRLWYVSTHEGTGSLAATLDGNFVPEPTSMVLVMTGLFGLLAYAWRKRK
jgi:hypothetical protein